MGVSVFGMHRSGTSVLAATLVGLGLDAGRPETLMPADEGNPEGYFEQLPIVALNDEILARLGGRWDSPPLLGEGWLRAEDLERARGLLEELYPTRAFVMKDPRVCVLADLWRQAAAEQMAGVFIVRDPLEVAWSLARRDAIPVLTGLALWAAFNRAAVAGMRGLPVVACNYSELVERPEDVLGPLGAALRDWGQLTAPDLAGALSRVNPDLRRNTAPVGGDRRTEAPAEIAELHEHLRALSGVHAHFSAPCPEPSWWELALLEERRLLVAEREASVSERDATIAELVAGNGALRAQSDELARDLALTRADFERLRTSTPVRVLRAVGRLTRR